MALTDCLKTALDGEEITQADYDRLTREFLDARTRAALASDPMADAAAKQALLDLLKAETAHQKRKARLTLEVVRKTLIDFNAHRNGRGEADVAGAALFKLEHFGEATFESVAGREKAVVGAAHARMESLLHNFRRSALLGDKLRHNRAQLRNVVREAFGEETGDAASKGFAKAWLDTAEWLRQRFNAAGGAIGKLENWGLPQRHDAKALRRRGRDAWKADIRPMLDVEKMRHPLTGKPVAMRDLDLVLDDVFTNITTDGWATRAPRRQAEGRGALGNQHAEHRFLIFKDADSWLKYQEAYGGGADAFGAMMGHINMMARDTAAMEILGPNPTATIEWFKQIVKKAGYEGKLPGKPENAIDRARRRNHRIDAVWGSLRGALDTPVSSTMAASFGGFRDWIVSSVMGAASISSLSDAGTSLIARKFAGIGGSATRDIIKAFLPSTTREAVAAGLILDSARHVLHTQARYVGTISGPTWVRYLADRTLTWSGLSPWTRAAKHAFGLAFFHEVANQADHAFDKMHQRFRETFQRYGFTASEWDKIRSAPKHPIGSNVHILRPREIADERLAERYLAMVQQESEYAVPDSSHRLRTLLIDQNPRGTIAGERLRSFAMFKSFGGMYAMLHGGRIARSLIAGRWGEASVYAGALVISSMALGGLSVQLKQVIAGKDPHRMDNLAFWMAGLMQGGGLGIYGDFLFANINRYGKGIPETVAGPMFERMGDFANLTAGNAIQYGQGKDTRFGRELINFARGNVPFMSIWYVRLAWERMVLDQLQWAMDPEAAKAFRTKIKNLERETGQEYFWAPGESQPARAPDLSAMVP